MTNECLMNFAETRGHEVLYSQLSENNAFTIEDHGCHIVLSNRLTRNEEKEAVAHELGHCEYGGFYNRCSTFDVKGKAEYRADKWAYHKIVPVRSVRGAFKKGKLTTWELAEQFEVSCQYMQKALEYYRNVGLL